jgi:TolA-binding protein
MRTLFIVVVVVGTLTGCQLRPLVFEPRFVRDWPATLQAAKEAARAGRYAEADSTLARFAARYPSSYQAREAAYWRALLLVDPANTQASTDEAFRALNQYFADGSTADGYDEATVLRRVVQRIDSLNRALAQADRLIAEAHEAVAEDPRPANPAQPPSPAAPTPAAPRENRAQARENRNLVDQVRRLREELSKSNQELERVRRRLSEQRP